MVLHFKYSSILHSHFHTSNADIRNKVITGDHKLQSSWRYEETWKNGNTRLSDRYSNYQHPSMSGRHAISKRNYERRLQIQFRCWFQAALKKYILASFTAWHTPRLGIVGATLRSAHLCQIIERLREGLWENLESNFGMACFYRNKTQ